MNLTDLNEDALEHIFQYLPLEDLDQLTRVCKKFHLVINVYIFAKSSAKLLLTGHQQKSRHCPNRDATDFSYRKRMRLHDNWRNGKYYETQFFYHRTIYFSQILLEKQWLYMTHRGQLRAHQRLKNTYMLKNKPSWIVGSAKDADINWVTRKEQVFFAGRNDGSGFVQDIENQCYSRQQLANDVITSVDFEEDIFVCTTKTRCTIFWRRSVEHGDYRLELSRKLDEPYQTIKLCPSGGVKLAAGKYHDRDKGALKLIDVESGSTSKLDSPTRAVYQLLWRDDSTILTGNFDTTMRMVDTRTARDESVWTDPYDASVYCLDYDGAYGVLCGMKYNFRVNLYDLRVPKRCIQMYYPSKKLSNYSPVHSLAADSSQLFIVTDHDLRALNFDADSAEKRDYTYDLDKWLY